MTFEPSASQAQIDARQHAFDNQPDPATLVSREEIRARIYFNPHNILCYKSLPRPLSLM